ncbi:hypothetical protein NBRC10513_004698 [Rhodotorula toruloides]|uniref:Major facilitator superfamily domain-containing protein n=1 Tax=Rhodotorula toruloides TaxID=5286 RepID=A0A2T0A6U1_RHOTO|nr:Major facilitator superfamily domain-containing protein [Rhodotorula toruloides]
MRAATMADRAEETVPTREISGSSDTRTKASAWWIIPPYFVFALLAGMTASIEVDLYGQIACRAVAASDGTFPQPTFPFLDSRVSKEQDEWMALCRSSPIVQKRTTSVVTTVLLVAGILSALTAAWWGSLSDRKGRKIVLAFISASETIQAIMMLLVLAFPQTFGFGFLLFMAAIAGLSGGQLAAATIAAAYLGDTSQAASKTQLLSFYEASEFAGQAVGPLIGPLLMRSWKLGPATPYTLSIFARLAYLAVIFLMPESLTPEKRKLSAVNTDGDDLASNKPATPLIKRLLAAPKELIEPFRILLPEKVNGRRDYKLLLVASSYFFLMVIPGLGPVKVLYARAKFGWAPEQVGRWITYTSLCKLVVLTAVIPLLIRLLRKSKTAAGTPDDDGQQVETQPLLGNQSPDAEQSKERRANMNWDASLALFGGITTVFGYLVATIPTKRPTAFLSSTALTAFAATSPPALQSIALTLAAPGDAGKVLACLSAIATVSLSALGPTIFGAVNMIAIDRWPEAIFVVAAAWVLASLVPLLALRLSRK